jgi:ABC-type transport system involved in multi-copper enzyme maturation permease subunit
MKALLWKDWRLARPMLIAAFALYCTPIIVGGVWVILSPTERPHTTQDWLGNCAAGLCFGLVVSLLATPLFGSVMFARERRDRTVEMVAAMPVPRTRTVFSKSIVVLLISAIPWLATTVGLWIIFEFEQWSSVQPKLTDVPTDRESVLGVLMLLNCAAMAVGSGWFFSSMLNKDTIAAGLSFLITILTVSLFFVVWYRMHPADDRIPHGVLAAISGGSAIAFFIAGIMVALKRRSP